ncbi:hypothetical protein GQ600_830 [Phytophthora cactorum]|nr:hypothetical protein GQ600_830 [Phytophthora cactorum]
MLHRKVFMAPTPIAAYNRCMNAVERHHPIRRREKRLGMAMFTWLIDIAITNSHTLLKTVRPAAVSGVELRWLTAYKTEKAQQAEARAAAKKSVFVRLLNDVVGADTLRNIKKKAKYGCTKCERAFMSSASLHFITVLYSKTHLNYGLHLRRSAERQRTNR